MTIIWSFAAWDSRVVEREGNHGLARQVHAGPAATAGRRLQGEPPLIFIIRKASDPGSEEQREIASIEALVQLSAGLAHELVLSRNLLKDHPVILVCDGPVE